MKRICGLFLSAVLLLSVLSLTASASYYGGMLSPALMNLSEEVTMVQSGLVSGDITFTAADFQNALGGTVDSITITALPPASAGTLLLGDSPVLTNQMISREALSKLRFVPGRDCIETSFRFKSGGEYSVDCLLRYTDSVNLAPVIARTSDVKTSASTAGADHLWTQQDITAYGTLSASDPEGDPITFEITRYPQNGLLRLTNPSSGDYCYTPCDGVTGEDSFSYVVRDEWGNYSAEASVIVDIDKAAADLVFADMDGHWAHNAALVMAAENAMDVEAVDGILYFHPDEEITREEFLVTVMKALGAGDIEPCMTVFADQNEMAASSTGYVARAYDLGIIKGVKEKDGLYFRPASSITRAEAAVMLNAILGVKEPDTVPVFADNSSVPAWAKGSLYALSEAGIFTGTGSGNLSPNASLSRAQTAQILLTVKKYLAG
ncbi:MAG: S-layer homology domain-containing protein [Eubacteriales bacterium]